MKCWQQLMLLEKKNLPGWFLPVNTVEKFYMRKIIMTLTPLAILLSPFAAAKSFSVDLFAATGESDNALKTSDNEISEKQNRYSASVQGEWDKQWFDANLQYLAYKESFADDSQEGENYLQGDSALKFGNDSHLLNLDLRHSRRTLLKQVADTPLTGNQEEREIFSVMPSARFDISGSDELVAYADLSRTRYLESELRDSDRNTYGIDHQHDFSAADKINLRLKQVKSEFIYFPQTDYTMNSAALVYSVSLRKLSYSLGAGQDRAKPEVGDEHSSPHYEASLNYKTGANQIRLYVDQSITDSSFGQGVDLAILDVPGVDAATDQLGIIERRTSGVDWSTTALCARCDLSLGITQSQDDYIDSESESTQRGASLTFRYNFSPRTLLLLSHSLSDQEPLTGLLTDEYRQTFSRISFRYQFLKSFSLELFHEKEKRSSDSEIQDYQENFTGLAIGYHFE
jgi:hypothetical protein